MIPRRPRPLCAICADRVATTITDWECDSGLTRTIVACWPCLSPVSDPPEEYEPVDLAERVRERATAPRSGQHELRDAVLQSVKRRGVATTDDIFRDVGFTDDKRSHASKVLSRLVAAGALAADEIAPGKPNQGRTYRVTGNEPVTPELAAFMCAVDAAPREFEPADLRCSAAALGELARLGYVECVRRPVKFWRDGKRCYTTSLWRKTGKPLPIRKHEVAS